VEMVEFLKYISGAVIGAGLTVGIIAKFGQSLFFKHLDHKYSERLVDKKAELQKELEESKSKLNKSLQQDVARYKTELEVLSGQRAKFLEAKIDSILELNKLYVRAIKRTQELTEVAESWVNEVYCFYEPEINNPEQDGYSDYSLYYKMKYDHWPNILEPANDAIEKYSDFLALKMPMLPSEFSTSEISQLEILREIVKSCEFALYRALGLSCEITDPEEAMSPQKCLRELEDHLKSVKNQAEIMDNYIDSLLIRSKQSAELVESLLGDR